MSVEGALENLAAIGAGKSEKCLELLEGEAQL
jgi:hypothetical protein